MEPFNFLSCRLSMGRWIARPNGDSTVVRGSFGVAWNDASDRRPFMVCHLGINAHWGLEMGRLLLVVILVLFGYAILNLLGALPGLDHWFAFLTRLVQ